MAESVERWVAEAMVDLCDRFDRACRESRRDCDVCESDCGSVVVSEERGRVESRFKYADVVGLWEGGGGRGDGISK